MVPPLELVLLSNIALEMIRLQVIAECRED